MEWSWVRGAALAGALAGGPLSAQGDPGDRLLESIYDKLADSFSAGQAFGKGGSFLILARPGIPVQPSALLEASRLALQLDQIPAASRQYRESGLRYSDVYGRILQMAQTTDRTDMKERNRFYKARNAIWDKRRPGWPTEKYAAYLKWEAEVARIQDANTTAMVEKKQSQPSPEQTRALEAAKAKWLSDGFKEEIEKEFAVLDGVYKSDVKTLFADLESELNLSIQGWPPFTADPPIEAWATDPGWVSWQWQATDLSREHDKPLLPLGSGPGSASPSSGSPGSFSCSVKLKRVLITRPWLDKAIFSSSSWRFSAFSGFRQVSTGQLADGNPGDMPLLVNGILLAKDLLIQGSWPGQGPAPLSTGAGAGAFSSSTSGVVIIGFFCEVIPKSPNPDPNLFR